MLDHPWIILIAVAVGLLRWLSQKKDASKDESTKPEAEPPPIPRGGETQTEEERVRRFLDALGQPAGSKPPPRVAPKRPTQPRLFPTLPPLTTVPPPPPAPAVAAPPPLPIQRRIFTPAPVLDPGFEVHDIAQASRNSPAGGPPTVTVLEQQSVISGLGSMQGLRNAIILREIFGPPRSLQPLDPINGF
ncbi:MAG: hypothetical protein QOE34_2416 [Verrucomicrobiota bacterium]|jgi:hypothetical protein